jgi:hypothetical protein
LEEFKSNSDKDREQQPTKKIEPPAMTGKTKVAKKSSLTKFADVFIAEDAKNVKTYILKEVVAPAIKKTVVDIVTTGINMVMYGDSGRSTKNGPAYKASYRSYYDSDREWARPGQGRKNTIDYDDILFDNRGDAEAVLDSLYDIMGQYRMVSVADFYEQSNVANDNFTLNRYGWTDLSTASVMRVRDGYIIKLPKAKVLSN